ncbi:hypothetical protein Hs30E_19080 [Lactococcus hodotermopsidis]|uniref:Lipoprotein n=1 Tax=Pseudolactococcus hodotermopsidis TaxID=2709157 RepID=A0A6A0BHY2_9LACT|nr:hypothetical protein [Lactococcus hodotermopsidis]GFH43357.1 hypothetical protein Hs30E_19080 [Lactococcus hodotermopsidis]
MKKKLKILVSLISLSASFTLFACHQTVSDKTLPKTGKSVQSEKREPKIPTPSQEIVQIADKIDFTQKGRDIFYTAKPEILDAEAFNENAPINFDSRATLGYYQYSKIFVYNIQKPELEGIVEVTAAHEALHAVWEALTSSEREKIGKLLEENYEKVKTDELEALMADYEKSEPGERENELHSILGTTYGNLSPALEKYYTKYFKNRGKIVQMSDNYQAKFDELEKKSEELSNELTRLKAEIDIEMPQYDADLATMDSEIETFNYHADNYYYSNEADFYADRDILQQKVAELDARCDAINAKVADFNAKNEELNQIALRATELYDSINSRAGAPVGVSG